MEEKKLFPSTEEECLTENEPDESDETEEEEEDTIPYSRLRVLWLIVGLACLALGAILIWRAFNPLPSNEIPEVPVARAGDAPMEAVHFTGMDGAHSVLDYLGEPVVYHFFPLTEDSLEGLALFEDAYKNYGKNIRFLVIATDTSAEEADAFFKKNSLTLPAFADPDGSALKACGFSENNATCFVDEEGFLAASSDGALDEETLFFSLAMLEPSAVLQEVE